MIVIGAGPGGCLAAILSARRGWDVRLVEQHAYGRHKVCGECLSSTGIAVLRRCELDQDLPRLGAVPLTHTAFFPSSGGHLRFRLSKPMLGLTRARLDGWLTDTARAAGAQLVQPARCESIDASPDRVTANVRNLKCNQVETLEADVAIIADGKPAARLDSQRPAADFGIKAHFANVSGPRNTIELYACAGRYGGLAAVENGLWNAAFSVSAAQLRDARGDVGLIFDQLVESNHTLRSRMRRAKRVGPWLTTPLVRRAPRAFPHRLIPIGNAACTIEPIGGEGMGLALRSAELAVEALGAASDWTPHHARKLLGQYRRLWQVRALACRTIARGVMSPAFTPALRLAKQLPAGVAAAMWLVGK